MRPGPGRWRRRRAGGARPHQGRRLPPTGLLGARQRHPPGASPFPWWPMAKSGPWTTPCAAAKPRAATASCWAAAWWWTPAWRWLCACDAGQPQVPMRNSAERAPTPVCRGHELQPLMGAFWLLVCARLERRQQAGRLKQWLNFMRRRYPQAEEAYDAAAHPARPCAGGAVAAPTARWARNRYKISSCPRRFDGGLRPIWSKGS